MSHSHVALVSLVAVSLLACAPGSSGPDADASSESTGENSDDASEADGAGQSSTTSNPATTSAPTTTGNGDATTASTTTSGSTDDGTTGDTGAVDSMYGRYVLVAGDATLTPDACATDSGPARNWSLDLGEPGEGGTFSALETYANFANAFACATNDVGFSCELVVVVDYGAMGGPDATVQLTSRYEATWGDAAIAGDYAVGFSCDGSECDQVADQWNVIAFPCDIDVAFTGARDPQDGA